jgi:hypothetical protein
MEKPFPSFFWYYRGCVCLFEKKTHNFNKGFKTLLKLGFPENPRTATKYTKFS